MELEADISGQLAASAVLAFSPCEKDMRRQDALDKKKTLVEIADMTGRVP